MTDEYPRVGHRKREQGGNRVALLDCPSACPECGDDDGVYLDVPIAKWRATEPIEGECHSCGTRFETALVPVDTK